MSDNLCHDETSVAKCHASAVGVQVNAMASDVKPLLADIRDGELVRNLEKLSGVAVEAAQELR